MIAIDKDNDKVVVVLCNWSENEVLYVYKNTIDTSGNYEIIVNDNLPNDSFMNYSNTNPSITEVMISDNYHSKDYEKFSEYLEKLYISEIEKYSDEIENLIRGFIEETIKKNYSDNIDRYAKNKWELPELPEFDKINLDNYKRFLIS